MQTSVEANEGTTRRRVDRALSGLGGLALLGAATRMHGWASLGAAALGGALLARALGPRANGHALMPRHTRDCVDQAGEESFPASDPPSWSPTAAGATQS